MAFGMTRYKDTEVGKDKNLKVLIDSGADGVCVVGKSSKLQAEKVIETTMENNLSMISDTVKYLKGYFSEVHFDAEHFFDGYREDPEYVLKTLEAASEAGADFICICDTNGGMLPIEVPVIVEKVRDHIGSVPLGVHFHNDIGCADANSLISVEKGAIMVQGTINGYGERCGNADLCTIIPSMEIKMGKTCLGEGNLKHITNLSRFVSETANQIADSHQPFVGHNAFAHKGGMHASGVSKLPEAFEHIKPDLVGNTRKILISELSGKKSIILKARELGIDLKDDVEIVSRILEKIQDLEHQGYQFEAADGSFELLIEEAGGRKSRFFTLESYRVLNERKKDGGMMSEATVKVRVGNKRIIKTAEGNGPVSALDGALREAIESCFPGLARIELTDFKVRVLNQKRGTSAVVRVLIESSDGEKTWGTIGVSENVIDASWQALEDSIIYGLMHLEKEKK
jgi:2-isopropylmalate synthase